MSRLGKLLTKQATCPECRCGLEGGWREDCGCTRYDCECNQTAGPDTDYDDTFNYQHPTGRAEPAKGKWWLGGRCSLACGDVECPPCQREELHKADRLPRALPPAAQPYQPPAKPTPARTSAAPTMSGATMTSADTYSGLRSRVMGIASRMPERQGYLQQALADVEQDIAELSQVAEDSNQAEIQEALGLLQQAKESIEQANWMVGGAQASTEGAAAALQ